MNNTLSICKFKENKVDKLEFGCGESLNQGFVGVDIRKYPGVQYNCNAWEIAEYVEKDALFINPKEYLNNKHLVLFGASSYGEAAFELLKKNGIEAAYFCDNDSKKWGKKLCGIDIISPEELLNNFKNSDILITSIYFKEISRQMLELGFDEIYYLQEQDRIMPEYHCIQPQELNSGERQVGCTIDKIRQDHVARYEMAAKQCKAEYKVLDIACGIGYGSYIMSPFCKGILAVDISTEAIEYAKIHYNVPNIEYIAENCMSIELDSDFFDLITCYETIEHIQDDEGFLKKLYGALKTGGTLLLSCPNQLELPFSHKGFPFHIRHYRPDEIVNRLNKAGFSIRQVYSQPDREKNEIINGWDGKFVVLLCVKE